MHCWVSRVCVFVLLGLEDNNVAETVDRVVRAALYQANFTRGNFDTMNIMWEMGEDFQVSTTPHNTQHEKQHFVVQAALAIGSRGV